MTDKTAAGDMVSGPVQLSGAGRIRASVSVPPDADSNITVGASNNVYKLDQTISQTRNYTLLQTSAKTGDTIFFFADATFTRTANIKDVSGTILYEIGNYDAADGPWASFIFLGGWRLFNRSQGSTMRTVDFLSSSTWTCPRGVTKILAYGYGGGGSGGAGSGNSDYYSDFGIVHGKSGAGGGGSISSLAPLSVTPGTTYQIIVGAGGQTGVFSGFGTETGITDATLTTRYLVFLGGTPGMYGLYNSVLSQPALPGYPYQLLGAPTPTYYDRTLYSNGYTLVPHAGGVGSCYAAVSGGYNLLEASDGSIGLSSGAEVYRGGQKGAASGLYGGGAGGGAGPGGNGADGGDAASGSGAGQAGADAAANSGAGGGGGGAGVGSGNDSKGGSGGSGKLTIYYVK